MKKFQNPFQKKEKKKKSNPKKSSKKIQIDFREKNSFIPFYLKKLNLETEIKELKIGDYLIENTIIERKTTNDLISSILDKRIYNQLKDMKQYPNYLLLIEGDFKKIKTKIHKNAIKGFLLSIAINHKIPIIFTKNEEDTAEHIRLIAQKQQKEISLNVSKTKMSDNERKNFVLQSFPGIGPIKSKQLLKEFKSLKNIFNQPKEKIEKILGKKSHEFFRILEGK